MRYEPHDSPTSTDWGNMVLRYCRTDLMAADGLTKLASSHVMKKLCDYFDSIFLPLRRPRPTSAWLTVRG